MPDATPVLVHRTQIRWCVSVREGGQRRAKSGAAPGQSKSPGSSPREERWKCNSLPITGFATTTFWETEHGRPRPPENPLRLAPRSAVRVPIFGCDEGIRHDRQLDLRRHRAGGHYPRDREEARRGELHGDPASNGRALPIVMATGLVLRLSYPWQPSLDGRPIWDVLAASRGGRVGRRGANRSEVGQDREVFERAWWRGDGRDLMKRASAWRGPSRCLFL
jgi:hypothetical protein